MMQHLVLFFAYNLSNAIAGSYGVNQRSRTGRADQHVVAACWKVSVVGPLELRQADRGTGGH